MLSQLQADTTAEVAVVTLHSITPVTTTESEESQTSRIHSFATSLFNRWGVGSAAENNGLLVLLVVANRRLEMITGRGLSRVLSNDWLKSCQQQTIVPLFKRGDFGGGVVAGVTECVRLIRADHDRRFTAGGGGGGGGGGSTAAAVVSGDTDKNTYNTYTGSAAFNTGSSRVPRHETFDSRGEWNWVLRFLQLAWWQRNFGVITFAVCGLVIVWTLLLPNEPVCPHCNKNKKVMQLIVTPRSAAAADDEHNHSVASYDPLPADTDPTTGFPMHLLSGSGAATACLRQELKLNSRPHRLWCCTQCSPTAADEKWLTSHSPKAVSGGSGGSSVDYALGRLWIAPPVKGTKNFTGFHECAHCHCASVRRPRLIVSVVAYITCALNRCVVLSFAVGGRFDAYWSYAHHSRRRYDNN